MAKGVRACLKHYSSTLENPQHQDCPSGASSWCKYQSDKATGKSTFKPVKDPIPKAVQDIISPVFDKLGNEKFLESCKNILSSNPNESFHHLLWGLAPKEIFNSSQEVNLAIQMSVCIYNSGFLWTYKKLLEECEIEISNTSLSVFRQIDTVRIKSADYQSSEGRKNKRKQCRRKKNNSADAFAKDYKSGNFHATGL